MATTADSNTLTHTMRDASLLLGHGPARGQYRAVSHGALATDMASLRQQQQQQTALYNIVINISFVQRRRRRLLVGSVSCRVVTQKSSEKFIEHATVVRPSVCLSLCLPDCNAVHCGDLSPYRGVESGAIVFLGGHFLFTSLYTFAVGCRLATKHSLK